MVITSAREGDHIGDHIGDSACHIGASATPIGPLMISGVWHYGVWHYIMALELWVHGVWFMI
jgi:hypothetical protein